MDHLLASVSSFMQQGSKAQLPTKKEAVKDNVTKVEHPGEVCDINGRCAQLFGVGPRRTRIAGFPVDVYSVGFYANPKEFKRHLHKHKGSSAQCLTKNASFIQDVKNPAIEKELRMVMTFRKVTKDKFWNAFQTRLTPLLSKEQQNSELQEFKGHFEGVRFQRRTEVRLALARDGSVATIIDGRKMGSVKSPAISSALVDIYLGDAPPSVVMKHDFLDAAAVTLAT